MEQGFPPYRPENFMAPVVLLTRCIMVPIVAFLAFMAFQTMRQPANKRLVERWILALLGVLAIGCSAFKMESHQLPIAVLVVIEIYLAIAALICVVAMQGCDFRFWRQTKSVTGAVIRSSLGGVGRAGLVLVATVPFWIFAEVFFPPPSAARPPARFAECRNNMKQLWLALQAAVEADNGKWPRSIDGKLPISWRVRFLPFMDQNPLWKKYDTECSWDDRENLPIAQSRVPTFQCPANPHGSDAQQRYFTSYVMVTGPGTASPGDRDIRADDFGDGISNTAVFVEAVGLNVVWTEPRDADAQTPIGINLKGCGKTDSPGLLSSYHSSGRANMTLADGSVRTINENIDPQVLKSLTTIAGNEPPAAE